MEKILFFATLQEASATLKRVKATLEGTNPLRFRFDQGYIFCTGMGLKNAFSAAVKAPKIGVEWINVGVAGSLSGNVAIGSICAVDRVGLLAFDGASLKYRESQAKMVALGEGSVALFSAREPIYYPITTGFDASLVDMEGYAIASVATRYRVPFRIVKAVSDVCSADSRAVIAQNLPRISEQIAQYIPKQL